MYHVTLVNLAPDARHAAAHLETSESRVLSAEELGALLENFRGLDPLENAEADPEIRLRHRSARYLVRTGQGRLFFRDGTDATQPMVALTVAEVLAELDGSAVAARSSSAASKAGAREIPHVAATAQAEVAGGTPAKRRARGLVLSGVVAILFTGIVALYLQRDRAVEPRFIALASTESADVVSKLPGVYVTGNEPGDRGIVVGADGAIRIFELNASGAPNFVHGTWRAGRIDGVLHLTVPQLRTFAKIVDGDTLDYCGERYLRAAAQ